MRKIVAFIFVFISLVLYIIAPNSYSWTYCEICAVLYVVNAFYGLQPIIKHNPISFGMFISITIFLCSFPFPLIIYPIDNSFSLFSFGYNHNVMTKCTALVCVAHSAYWFGVEIAKEKYIRKLFVNKITVDDFLIKKFIRYVIILFALFIGLGGLKFFTDRYLDGNMSSNVTFTYINLIFTTISILLACMCLFANNKKVLHLATIVLFMVCITILFTGSRTLPMFLMLPLAYVYQKKYNISMTKMGICLLVILVFFIIVGQIRHSVISIDAFSSYENKDSEFGVWGNFTDFIVCNRNLYDIYDIVDREGYLYGKNFLSSFLSTVPFLQGIVSKILDIPSYQMDSAYFCTYKMFGNDAPLGLGTHVVGDVYLSMGIIGVVALFYFLGNFITKIENGARIYKNQFLYIVYLNILSYSVFFCRGSFWGPIRGIIWSAVILYFVNKFRRCNGTYTKQSLN